MTVEAPSSAYKNSRFMDASFGSPQSLNGTCLRSIAVNKKLSMIAQANCEAGTSTEYTTQRLLNSIRVKSACICDFARSSTTELKQTTPISKKVIKITAVLGANASPEVQDAAMQYDCP